VTEHRLWHCPKCGARLVNRNLWHSCGRFTLEALFSGSGPGVLAAARQLWTTSFARGCRNRTTSSACSVRCQYGPLRWERGFSPVCQLA
jgi:hypothetical protein